MTESETKCSRELQLMVKPITTQVTQSRITWYAYAHVMTKNVSKEIIFINNECGKEETSKA